MTLVVALFMFQVETALPGAPDVCEEPCEGKAVTTEATPIDPVTTPDGSPTKAVEAQVTEPSIVTLEPPGKSVEGPAVTQLEPRLLPFRLIVPTPRGSVPVARGAMGYRVPLVVKQEVPSRIRGGVYVPAHETYVVLRPGHWEMEEPEKGLAQTGPEVDAVKTAGDIAKPEPERRGWLQRLLGREGRGSDGGS